MSIATEIERLQTAKANIKNAIEQKGVTVGDGTIDTYAEKIGEISVGDNYYDTFWDSFQQNGNLNIYDRAFGGAGWNDTTFNPKYSIRPASAREMFAKTRITKKESLSNVDFSQCEDFYMTFMGSYFIELPVINASNGKDFYYSFNSSYDLETIEKLIMSENVTRIEGMFSGCGALKNITFEGVIPKSISFLHSSLLTSSSVQSIIDHLKDLSGGTAQTLTLHATVGGKLTDEQKASITAKNWTLVY